MAKESDTSKLIKKIIRRVSIGVVSVISGYLIDKALKPRKVHGNMN